MALSASITAAYDALAAGEPVTQKLMRAVMQLLTPQFERQDPDEGDDAQVVELPEWQETLSGVCAAAEAAGSAESLLISVLKKVQDEGRALVADITAAGGHSNLRVGGDEGERAQESTVDGGAEVWRNPAAGNEDMHPETATQPADEGVHEGAEEEGLVQNTSAKPEEPYIHPADGQDYLSSEVMPVLREGLATLVARLEQEKLGLAAGNDWEAPHGYLPHNWLPFSPYRWLANWLLEHSSEPPADDVAPYSSLTLIAKAELWFDAAINECLHTSHSRLNASPVANAIYESDDSLPFHVMCDKLKVLNPDLSPESVVRQLAVLDKAWLLNDGEWAEGGYSAMSVSKETAVRLVVALTQQAAQSGSMADAEYRVDALLHSCMGQLMLEYCVSIEDKCRFIYLTLDSVDAAYPQRVPAEQLLQLLPRGLDLTEAEALEKLEADGRRPSDQLSCAEVHLILSRCLPPSMGAADDQLVRLVSAAVAISRGLPSELVSAMVQSKHDPLEEVEPEEFVEYIRSLPTSAEVPQVSTSEVQDYSFSARTSLLQPSEAPAGDPNTQKPKKLNKEASVLHSASMIQRTRKGPMVLLIDVRTTEEVAVSAIPGALHAPAAPNPMAVKGWAFANDDDVAALRERVELAGIRGQSSYLILYCNTGERSGALAMHLRSSRLLGSGVDIAVMCGGIINYFNLGGCVKDPSQAVVQTVHPGSADMKRFITRPNKFKLF